MSAVDRLAEYLLSRCRCDPGCRCVELIDAWREKEKSLLERTP